MTKIEKILELVRLTMLINEGNHFKVDCNLSSRASLMEIWITDDENQLSAKIESYHDKVFKDKFEWFYSDVKRLLEGMIISHELDLDVLIKPTRDTNTTKYYEYTKICV